MNLYNNINNTQKNNLLNIHKNSKKKYFMLFVCTKRNVQYGNIRLKHFIYDKKTICIYLIFYWTDKV